MFYNELIKKIKDRLQHCKGKLLSFGGKVVLINNVLQNMPLYLQLAMDPTKYTITEIHRVFAILFWSNKEEERRHWSKWWNICLPKEEGGLGLKSPFEVYKALFDKTLVEIQSYKYIAVHFYVE